MKKNILLLSLLFVCVGALAQNPKDEITKNIKMSASNYVAYPGPKQQGLSPAPSGYKPFYISHYGRHGSRYLIGKDDYDEPYSTLSHADSLGELTTLGRDVLRRVSLLRADAANREGELTPLGARQHREIARRMYERFPDVFSGNVSVDAKSTIVIRCILSMSNALHELTLLNPKLNIHEDASYHDMYYMNLQDKHLNKLKKAPGAKQALKAFNAKHQKPNRVMGELFKDTAYWHKSVDANKLFFQLFTLAANVQSNEADANLSLYDIFTTDELYNEWLAENAYWYTTYGPSKLTGGIQPYSQRNLLRKIISQADTCLTEEHQGATLRFGHETMVLPLTCLLNLNGYGNQINDLENLTDSNWVNYRIIPMGANIQFIFYRKAVGDKDVILKVLLNENEATLPIKTDIAPYYHWKDVREYYLNKLDAYKQ